MPPFLYSCFKYIFISLASHSLRPPVSGDHDLFFRGRCAASTSQRPSRSDLDHWSKSDTGSSADNQGSTPVLHINSFSWPNRRIEQRTLSTTLGYQWREPASFPHRMPERLPTALLAKGDIHTQGLIDQVLAERQAPAPARPATGRDRADSGRLPLREALGRTAERLPGVALIGDTTRGAMCGPPGRLLATPMTAARLSRWKAGPWQQQRLDYLSRTKSGVMLESDCIPAGVNSRQRLLSS